MWLFEGEHPQRLRYLNTWSPVGGAVWGGLGGVASVKEVCHWIGWGFEMIGYLQLPGHLLCFVLVVENVNSQLPAPAAMLAARTDSYPSGNTSPNEPFLL